MDDVRAALAAACRERDITGPDDFRRRFGVAPAALTPRNALTLVTTPDWVTEMVTEIWIPNSGTTPVVYVPQAVRTYAAVFGIAQCDGESDHDFNKRLRGEIRGHMTSVASNDARVGDDDAR
jgi:hypothetical protein